MLVRFQYDLHYEWGNCISKLEPIVKDALNNNDNHYHFQHLIIIII